MFDVLRERLSLTLSRYWPTAEGKITRIYLDPTQGDFQVTYEFSLENDGPYTGQCYPPFWFGGTAVVNTESLVGNTVLVRYRRSDPSVNTLDRGFWQDLEGI